VERMTLRVVRGAPDPRETAALAAVLAAALGGPGRHREPAGRRPRPAWRAFTGHRDGGWGQP
jgi:hypothetical protein